MDMNKSFNELSIGKENKPFTVPTTPKLKQLGYGTGVGVFHVDRSPRNGLVSSPWALKKIMRQQSSFTKKMAERLRNEAEILRKLNHPNIVGFRAFVKTTDGRECLAMEECHTSLGDLLEDNEEFLPVKKVQKVAVEIAKALDYIHNVARLLHGDIKSHNILIKGDFDEIKLCDFGVSLPLNEDGTVDVKAAGKNTYVGTRMWMAPEVCEDRTKPIVITDKADIFPYGLTIWEMFTNRIPHSATFSDDSEASFDEDAYEERLNEVVGTRPPLPEDVADDKQFENVILLFCYCTEENYKKRYSAKQILQFCVEHKF